MAEKDIYRDLSERMFRVFGAEALEEGSHSLSEITAMVSSLVDQIGPENVTELNLVGIREILDGEHDPTFHISASSMFSIKRGKQ